MSSRIRRLLGLGVLLLTMVSGYVASRVTGAHDRSDVNNVSAALDAHIKDVANRYGVSADLIVAIIEAESSFNPRAVSRRGARGLMQLMPETAASLGVGDPFDPRENIEGGVRHLRALMDRFDNNLPLVLAAYNAGRQAVIDHRGVPPYRQTRQYVSRILRRLDLDDAKASDPSQRWRKASS
jgi:soluble lytic murein transglycosylase-like protein